VLTGGIAPYGSYLTKDGGIATLGSLEPKFWFRFAAATGVDPDPVALFPGEHQAGLRNRIAEVFRSRTTSEWRAFAQDNDCCVETALAPGELASDEQLRARGLFFEQTVGGEQVPGFRTPVSHSTEVPPGAPRAGEHTRVILRESGWSDTEIDSLVAAGVATEG
jgi:crotonobetainyl-CoA:carnitine CoA-transferase CaiB-like acyl-CoA transferase